MVPEVGASSPATMLRTEDLPQPVGPTTARNCPRGTLKLIPRIAGKAPYRSVTSSRATAVPSVSNRNSIGKYLVLGFHQEGPRHTGARFSTKAAIPSLPSGATALHEIASAIKRYASDC